MAYKQVVSAPSVESWKGENTSGVRRKKKKTFIEVFCDVCN
jgi:hypothetical protein